MSRPAFQFYTKDWRSNSKLRRCSSSARGVWIDVLCALHDSDEYGVARYPLKELAAEVGANLAHVRELVDKGVLKGSDGALVEPFIYTPRSGRKDGDPRVLVPAQAGPIWYSSRMVRDEHVRNYAGAATRFGAPGRESKPDAPRRDDDSPGHAPPRREGDGLSSASSSASALQDPEPPIGDLGFGLTADPPEAPKCPHDEIVAAYHRLLPMLPSIVDWTPARAKSLRLRWREDPKRQTLAWWERFFRYIAKSKFLTGQADPRPGQAPFVADIDFILRPSKFVQIREGKFHEVVQ